MIQTYSTTIRRKEMDAVLTCMVDEKIGPGDLNTKLIQQVKEFTKCDGAVALRSPAIALKYALRAFDLEEGSKIMISALAPAWQYLTILELGFEPFVLDVDDNTGLVTSEIIYEGMKQGGKFLILHETEGILPDFDSILELGIPFIEDISQSAGAFYTKKVQSDQTSNADVEKVQAGSFGTFAIMGLEEKDVITCGGGAILYASGRREWIILKKIVDNAPVTDLLPDINSALAWVQIKEYPRNEATRKELFALFQHACLVGRHKMFAREMDDGSTMCSFPLILSSSFKDVKHYCSKKDIEVRLAFENSVISYCVNSDPEENSELSAIAEKCIHAKSLYLRCVHFPMYPRISKSESVKIVKVLSSLP